MLPRYLTAFCLTILLFGSCKQEEKNINTPIQIIDVWTRPYKAEKGITTAIYLTLDNRNEAPTALVGAQISLADTVEIHQSTIENGVMRMRPVPSVEIPGRSTITFQPGGNHLMVKGLELNLAEGDSLRLTLLFNDKRKVRATADVRWE